MDVVDCGVGRMNCVGGEIPAFAGMTVLGFAGLGRGIVWVGLTWMFMDRYG